MQEFGLRPRSFFFGNICFKFSVYCLYSVLYKAMFASLYQVPFFVNAVAIARYRWLRHFTVGCFNLPVAVTLYQRLLCFVTGSWFSVSVDRLKESSFLKSAVFTALLTPPFRWWMIILYTPYSRRLLHAVQYSVHVLYY